MSHKPLSGHLGICASHETFLRPYFSAPIFPTALSAGYDGDKAAHMVMSAGGDEYYTAEEACTVLGVKLATLYSYVNRGLLTSYRQNIRRHRLYRCAEVDALLEVSPVTRDELTIEIPLAETWTLEH